MWDVPIFCTNQATVVAFPKLDVRYKIRRDTLKLPYTCCSIPYSARNGTGRIAPSYEYPRQDCNRKIALMQKSKDLLSTSPPTLALLHPRKAIATQKTLRKLRNLSVLIPCVLLLLGGTPQLPLLHCTYITSVKHFTQTSHRNGTSANSANLAPLCCFTMRGTCRRRFSILEAALCAAGGSNLQHDLW